MNKTPFIFIPIFLFFSSFGGLKEVPGGLKKGEKAPLFEAKDNLGKMFRLKEKLRSGPVVIVFYRGQWCPYCNKYLSQLEDSLKLITAKGASVIAISPETNSGVEKTIEKTKASFPVIHDEKLAISQLYQVNYAIDEQTNLMYTGYGIDVEKANGSNGANLPVPATYVIGKDGTVQYVFFNPDFTKRAAVQEILKYL